MLKLIVRLVKLKLMCLPARCVIYVLCLTLNIFIKKGPNLFWESADLLIVACVASRHRITPLLHSISNNGLLLVITFCVPQSDNEECQGIYR